MSAPGAGEASCSPRLRLAAIAGLGCVIVAALFVFKLRESANDDFFITYRYAANLAAGRGLVYNPGERVFGVTEPGQGLLLAALSLVTPLSIPWLATLLTAAGVLALGLLLWRDAGGGELESIAAAVLLASSSYLWANNGCGGLAATALLLAAAAVVERRPAAAGTLAGLAVWFRPDALVGVALLAGLLGWARRLRLRFAIAAAIVVLTGVAAAWLYFGTPLPNTLGAKATSAEAAGDSTAGARFWLRGALALENHWGATWPAIVLAGAAGGVAMVRRGNLATRLLALHGGTLALAYPFLGVPFFPWYAVPTVAALLCGVAWAAVLLARTAWRAGRAHRRSAAGLLLAGVLAALAAGPIDRSWRFYRRAQWPPPYMAAYREAGLWLRDNTPAAARVAYLEIGILGYYSERPVYDLMGLVSPQALPFVKRHDLFGAFRAAPTDYVIFHTRGGMGDIVSRPWFRQRYRQVARFAQETAAGGELVIYQRRRRRA